MQILTIDKDKFVAVDGDKATVYSKTNLTEQIQQAEARLSEIPTMPSDEELLAWARVNYPQMDYSNEKASLEAIVVENTRLLSEIK